MHSIELNIHTINHPTHMLQLTVSIAAWFTQMFNCMIEFRLLMSPTLSCTSAIISNFTM